MKSSSKANLNDHKNMNHCYSCSTYVNNWVEFIEIRLILSDISITTVLFGYCLHGISFSIFFTFNLFVYWF